jgi:tetratricopeptide (TPR) repeat protein
VSETLAVPFFTPYALFSAVRVGDTTLPATAREAHLRHAKYYLQLCLQTRNSGAGGELWRETLGTSAANIRLGHNWAEERSQTDSVARDLYCRFPLAIGVEVNGAFARHELIAWHKKSLSESEFIADHRQGLEYQLECSRNLGSLFQEIGELRQSVDNYLNALDCAHQLADRRGEGQVLGLLGQTLAQMGDHRASIKALRESLVIAREVDDVMSEGSCLAMLGNNCIALGLNTDAINFFVEAWNAAGVGNNRQLEISALAGVGLAYSNLGDYSRAILYYNEALARSRALGDKAREGQICLALGSAFLSLEDLESAIATYQMSADLAREAEDRITETGALAGLGASHFASGNYVLARENQEKACDLAQMLGDRPGEATTRQALSMTLQRLELYGEADLEAQRAHQLLVATGSPLAESARRLRNELQASSQKLIS